MCVLRFFRTGLFSVVSPRTRATQRCLFSIDLSCPRLRLQQKHLLQIGIVRESEALHNLLSSATSTCHGLGISECLGVFLSQIC